jgi:putative membrane protein
VRTAHLGEVGGEPVTNRFPRSLYSRGSEPDPRFSLANERTFLAWVRTSLALLAAGVALEALQVPISPGFRLASAVVFVLLGVLAAVQAWVGWLRTERALRENQALPAPSTGLVIIVGVVLGVVLLTLGFFW